MRDKDKFKKFKISTVLTGDVSAQELLDELALVSGDLAERGYSLSCLNEHVKYLKDLRRGKCILIETICFSGDETCEIYKTESGTVCAYNRGDGYVILLPSIAQLLAYVQGKSCYRKDITLDQYNSDYLDLNAFELSEYTYFGSEDGFIRVFHRT